MGLMLFSNKTHKPTCPSFPYTNTAQCMAMWIFVLCSETCRYWPPVVRLKPCKIKQVTNLHKAVLKSPSFASILTSYELTHCFMFVIMLSLFKLFRESCNPMHTTYLMVLQWMQNRHLYLWSSAINQKRKTTWGTTNCLTREGAT